MELLKDGFDDVLAQIKTLSKAERDQHREHFNTNVCPGEDLGDLLFGDSGSSVEELDEKITGMDNETYTQFAKALQDSELVQVED